MTSMNLNSISMACSDGLDWPLAAPHGYPESAAKDSVLCCGCHGSGLLHEAWTDLCPLCDGIGALNWTCWDEAVGSVSTTPTLQSDAEISEEEIAEEHPACPVPGACLHVLNPLSGLSITVPTHNVAQVRGLRKFLADHYQVPEFRIRLLHGGNRLRDEDHVPTEAGSSVPLSTGEDLHDQDEIILVKVMSSTTHNVGDFVTVLDTPLTQKRCRGLIGTKARILLLDPQSCYAYRLERLQEWWLRDDDVERV